MPAIRRRKPIEYIVLNSDCHECTSHSVNDDGYPRVFLKGKPYRISRIIYERHKGEIPDGMVVRHTCDNRMCINPDHMVIGTHADNVSDRVSRGRSATGERNGRAKLQAKHVKQILESTDTHASLARRFGVSDKAIRLIRQRKTWVSIK